MTHMLLHVSFEQMVCTVRRVILVLLHDLAIPTIGCVSTNMLIVAIALKSGKRLAVMRGVMMLRTGLSMGAIMIVEHDSASPHNAKNVLLVTPLSFAEFPLRLLMHIMTVLLCVMM